MRMNNNDTNEQFNNENELKEYMLTTVDNPFNPFKNFDEWFAYDTQKGYNTCSYLARVIKTSDELSENDDRLATNQAINEIIEADPFGIYIKVTENDKIIPILVDTPTT